MSSLPQFLNLHILFAEDSTVKQVTLHIPSVIISGLRVNLRLVIAGACVGGLVWGAEFIEVNVVYKGVVGVFRASNV